jgi:hypothetical protein
VPLVSFTLNYGDPGGTDWKGKPFDVFTVRGRLRCGPDRPHLSLFVGGTLAGKSVATSAGSYHFFGLQQEYEYYGIDTLRIGGSSFAGGVTSRFAFSPQVRLTAAARMGWMFLSGTEDFAAVQGERREYNIGTGWTAVVEASIGVGGFEIVSAGWRHYGLFTLEGQAGRETWDVLQGQVRFPVWKKLGLGFQVETCGRRMRFKDVPPGERWLHEARGFLTWQF